jgi:hypothetical protein
MDEEDAYIQLDEAGQLLDGTVVADLDDADLGA